MPGGTVRSKSGAMIHMSGTIQLQGNIKFSMKKLFTGGRMSESTYTGPGRLALGPTLMGRHHHAARRRPDGLDRGQRTLSRLYPRRGHGNQGTGSQQVHVFPARTCLCIDSHLANSILLTMGTLVAWSCDYKIEKAGGGAMSSLKTGEGLVCRFTGPGAIYVQTRNMDEFDSYISSRSSS
ncbi:hypothetical protein J3459_021656 [Metarhizium acridum]|nr:hypothetical protein J3459_021656 [Metarhizium acridum]